MEKIACLLKCYVKKIRNRISLSSNFENLYIISFWSQLLLYWKTISQQWLEGLFSSEWPSFLSLLSWVGDKKLLDWRYELRHFNKKLRKKFKKAISCCFVHNMQHLALGVEFFKKVATQSFELFYGAVIRIDLAVGGNMIIRIFGDQIFYTGMRKSVEHAEIYCV